MANENEATDRENNPATEAEVEVVNELKNEEEAIIEDTNVSDPEPDESSAPARYNISSYGWDSDVEGLVKRLGRGDIFVPGFQRGFVWRSQDKSSFIESLILGLPVPNIFLAQDSKTKSLNIVDGQQRLRTLESYLKGEFYLTGKKIQPELRGCYFSTEVAKSKSSKVLDTVDARTLADSVIHSIVIKPDSTHDDPELGHEYNQAIIQIFKRLNTSGKPLNDQEIRTSIFYGPLDNAIRELNEDENWRILFGNRHSRLKDMELILRFIALRKAGDTYKSPMGTFLTGFMEDHRYMPEADLTEIKNAFPAVTKAIVEIFGRDIIRSGSTLIVSKFDAITVGIDAFIKSGRELSDVELNRRLAELEANEKYQRSIDEFVNDTDRVTDRIELAKSIFGA